MNDVLLKGLKNSVRPPAVPVKKSKDIIFMKKNIKTLWYRLWYYSDKLLY